MDKKEFYTNESQFQLQNNLETYSFFLNLLTQELKEMIGLKINY